MTGQFRGSNNAIDVLSGIEILHVGNARAGFAFVGPSEKEDLSGNCLWPQKRQLGVRWPLMAGR